MGEQPPPAFCSPRRNFAGVSGVSYPVGVIKQSVVLPERPKSQE